VSCVRAVSKALIGKPRLSAMAQCGMGAVALAACLMVLHVEAAAASTSFGGDHGLSICEEAGCLYGPLGVAVDPTTGDVYIAEMFNNRVSAFSASGEFLFAFGYGVRNGADELQTCTVATGCENGLGGGRSSAPGDFDEPQAVAVNANGQIYVTDFGYHRVEEFKPEKVGGETIVDFVLMFGGGVDKTTGGNVCPEHPGDACGAGAEGNRPAQIGDWAFEADNLASGGPEGDIYIGDQGRVDVFAPGGVFVKQISLGGLSAAGRVGALAVDPAGDVFVQLGAFGDGGLLEPGAVPGVHEFEPSGTEKAVQIDPGGWANSLATDGSKLYVADPEGGMKILGYRTTSARKFQSFEPEIGSYAFGMAAASVTGRLYITGDNDLALVVPVPPPGPLVKRESETVTPEPRGAATLRATIDPEGDATGCRFEYVLASQYEPSAADPYVAGASVPCEPADLGEGFANVSVVAHLNGLKPGAIYHWRVVATNAVREAAGEDQQFEETPPALVDGPWSSEVSSDSVVLSARIDPLGADTSYRLEYGTSASYGQVVTGDVGGGEAYVLVSASLVGLQPHTVYHFRLVTSSTTGTTETSDRTFTTQLANTGLALLDERAWEQISPPEKHGASIVSEEGFDVWQAAEDGNSVTYVASSPVSQEPHTSLQRVSVLSIRGEAGWRSMEPMPTKSLPPEGSEESAANLVNSEFPPFYSTSLSHALIEPSPFVSPLAPEASEFTLYVYDAATGSYRPIVTPEDVETSRRFSGRLTGEEWMSFRGASSDLSHVLFVSPFPLTKEALAPPDLPVCEKHEPCNGEENLYEWAGGRLHLVNILPDGKPTVGAFLGRGDSVHTYSAHAVSSDGSWVVWTHFVPGMPRPALYVRDMTNEETQQVGGKEAVYETMSGSGSRVFYLESGDLHALDTATRVSTDITSTHEPADVQDTILGASENGTVVYVVARGALTSAQGNADGETALPGKPNVYELHDTGAGWSTTYIATLSPDDEHDWFASELGHMTLLGVTSHVSPSGRFTAFMSDRPLTGYDNVDVKSSERDEEVFLFDAQTQRLVCVSCDPTGARPGGVFDPGFPTSLGVDPENAWANHWLAGSIPGWRPYLTSFPMYQPRVLLDSGRLFFQSPDALVPQDSNGQEDVYEYEPSGVGTCAEQGATFVAGAAGCVNLVSSGVSTRESVFFDASVSGNDAFFSTSAKLAWSDLDEAFDVYDARSPHSSGEPVGFPQPPRPLECEGDACQGTPPTVIDKTPSSLTFVGPGNRHPSSAKRHRRSTRRRGCRKRHTHRHGRCSKARRHRARRGRRTEHRRRGGQ